MKIGIVFHKNPFAPPIGIDLVRLRAIAGGLIQRGIEAEIVSPVKEEGSIEGGIPVRTLDALTGRPGYDLVKTSYHYSIDLIRDYRGPVVSRIVRVVDDRLPERDEPFRQKLLDCQSQIRARSAALILNNRENEERWARLYGDAPPIVLIPTGCPAVIPPPRRNPYGEDERVMLFLGSLAAPRMVRMLNRTAERLEGICRVHLVGRNKSLMYGSDQECRLNSLIVDHGELVQDDVWDYIRHADIGVALATGPHAFDNDVSKILSYLRGGLPVLSEEPIINNRLIELTEFGTTFPYGNMDELVARAVKLLENPPLSLRERAMQYMAREHSWERRVETYVTLFTKLLGEHQ